MIRAHGANVADWNCAWQCRADLGGAELIGSGQNGVGLIRVAWDSGREYCHPWKPHWLWS